MIYLYGWLGFGLLTIIIGFVYSKPNSLTLEDIFFGILAILAGPISLYVSLILMYQENKKKVIWRKK